MSCLCQTARLAASTHKQHCPHYYKTVEASWTLGTAATSATSISTSMLTGRPQRHTVRTITKHVEIGLKVMPEAGATRSPRRSSKLQEQPRVHWFSCEANSHSEICTVCIRRSRRCRYVFLTKYVMRGVGLRRLSNHHV